MKIYQVKFKMLLFTREKPLRAHTHTHKHTQTKKNQTHICVFSLIPLAFLIFFIGSLQLPLIKVKPPSLLFNSLKCIIKMIFLKRHNVISNYLTTLLLNKQTSYKIITCEKKIVFGLLYSSASLHFLLVI